MTTSGPHGLEAEAAITEALRLDRHDANRQLWATLGLAHAMLSVSGQLGEILAYMREVDGQPPSAAHPAFAAAQAETDPRVIGFAEATTTCSADCVLLPGHDGQCIPPGSGLPYRRCDSVDSASGRRCQTYAGHGGLHSADIPDPFLATGKFAEWSDDAPVAPVTGPMPAVVP